MIEISQLPMSNNSFINSKNIPSKKERIQKSNYVEFNLDKIGSIKYAKIHSKANRPLYKVDGTKFNGKTEFCRCCNLPAIQEGIIEEYKFFDDPDKFAECGEGISLYFTFIKFAIIIIFITMILVGISNLIFSKKYTEDVRKICNNFNNDDIKNLINEDCKLFLNSEDNSKFSSIINSYFFTFNSINTKNYRNLFYKLTSSDNKKIDKVIINTSYMNFICLITLFIFNIFYIIYINLKSKEIDISILSLSDYSILISNLKGILKKFLKMKKKITEEKIDENECKEELENKLGINKLDLTELDQFICFLKNRICILNDGEKLNINKVNICFKISKLMKLENQLNKINEKVSKVKNFPYQILKNKENNLEEDDQKYYSSPFDYFGFHCCEKTEDLKELKNKQIELKKEINDLMENSKKNTMEYFNGCVIICLNTIKEQESLLDEYSYNLFIYLIKLLVYFLCKSCINKNKEDLFWKRRNIRFERSPEPEDILFENLEYINSLRKVLRILSVYFFSFILIFFCFLIVTSLNYLQKYIDENKDFHIVSSYTISLLISCCILIINTIFEKLLDYLTKYEKQSTTTNYYLSKSIKLTIFSFMNSGIVPLISELYIKTDGYEYLINNMEIIFLVNAILIPISWTMNFSYFYKKIKICLIERKQHFNENHGKTQRELNKLYELSSMNISEKYSYVYKTILITFFYIPIFPLGSIISLFGLCFGYLLEKYNFCHMYKRPEMLNDQLCKSYINHFIIALLLNGAGDFIFKKDVYDTKLWSFLNIIIFGVLIIVPYNYFLNYIIKDILNLKESRIHKTSLDNEYFSFFNDYERANPMTKKEGLTNYLNGLKSKGYISDTIYKENIENLQNVNLMHLYYNESKNRNILKSQKSIINKENNYKFNILIRTLSFNDKEKEEKYKKFLQTKSSFKIKDISNTNTIIIPFNNKNITNVKDESINEKLNNDKITIDK